MAIFLYKFLQSNENLRVQWKKITRYLIEKYFTLQDDAFFSCRSGGTSFTVNLGELPGNMVLPENIVLPDKM